jgi:hypothetical protein
MIWKWVHGVYAAGDPVVIDLAEGLKRGNECNKIIGGVNEIAAVFLTLQYINIKGHGVKKGLSLISNDRPWIKMAGATRIELATSGVTDQTVRFY